MKSLQILILAAACASLPVIASAELNFVNTETGMPLDINNGPKEGIETPAAKEFLNTGVNPYIEVKSCLPGGQQDFLAACSGCHGEVGEGKIGPALNDDYWTYPKNTTNKGMFETVWGGARAQMGPHNDLGVDQVLRIEAWIRHLYTGPVKDADWLTAEQKKNFKPYDAAHPVDLPEEKCTLPGT